MRLEHLRQLARRRMRHAAERLASAGWVVPGLTDLGLRGEALAVRALRRRGYRIVETRWRCQLGEIDIVAWDGATLAIVEVKSRRRDDFGSPVSAVGPDKQRRLIRLAGVYVKQRRLGRPPVRFDIAGVLFGPKGPEITLVPRAFAASAEPSGARFL